MKSEVTKHQAVGSNFLVTIYHQENYSWQGVIQWLDTGKKVHFRSELEMINLMHNALESQSEESDCLRTWDDAKPQLSAM